MTAISSHAQAAGQGRRQPPAIDVGLVVGREQELARVHRFLEDPTPAALLIEGAAGIGKTTLWEAGLRHSGAEGHRTLSCRPVDAEASLSYSALGDLLALVPHQLIAELPAPQRRGLEVALLLAEPSGQPPNPRAIGLALQGVLARLAGEAPVLVAIDDLQWLDAASALVLRFALRRDHAVGVRFLAAARGNPNRSPAPPLGVESFDWMTLDGLSPDALHSLLRLRLGLELPRPLVRKVHALAEGNPFYAIEIAQRLRGQPDPLDPLQPLPVPGAIEDLVAERVSGLSRSARDVLAVTSAAADATAALLASALSDQPGVADGLQETIEADLLEVRGERVRFVHPLLGAHVYSRLTPLHRREVHRRLGESAQDLEQRARHLALSVDGPDERIVTELQAGAIAAAHRGAPGVAAELAELAVERTQPGRSYDLVRRRLDAARWHFLAGEVRRSRALLERLSGEMPPGPLRAEVLLELAWARKDDVIAATALCERAAEHASRDPGLLSRVHDRAGYLWLTRCELERASQHAAAGVEAAERSGDERRLALALAHQAMLAIYRGEPTQTTLDRALALERRVGTASISYGPSVVRAVAAMYAGRLTEARALLRAQHRKAVRQGDEHAGEAVLAEIAALELRAGNWPLAARHADRCVAISEQLGFEPAFSLAGKALVAAHRGLESEAREAAEQGLANAEGTHEELAGLHNQAVIGFLELSLGDHRAAARVLEPVVARLAAAGWAEVEEPRVLPNAAEAMIACGQLEEARLLLVNFEADAQRLGRPWARAAGARCRGLWQAASGDLESALGTLRGALAVQKRRTEPFEQARTLLVLGTTLRRAKQKRAARESLEAALETFDALGAKLWVRRTRAETARIAGRRPAASQLTVTETRIAELVAAGSTNQQVAAALYIAPRTVEWNLSKIYAKLGIRSRVELASRMASEGQPEERRDERAEGSGLV